MVWLVDEEKLIVAALQEVMWYVERAWPELCLTHQTLPRGWAGIVEMRGVLDLEMIRGNDVDSSIRYQQDQRLRMALWRA